MRLKKNWTRVLSSALAVTIALSGTYGMPVTAFAATDNSDAIVQSDGDTVTESTSIDITSNFESISYEAPFTYDTTSKTITMGNYNNGDHFAVYKGLDKKTNSFVLEADINIVNGPSAALVFGNGTKVNPFTKWYGANVDTNNGENAFRLFGPVIGDISDKKGVENIDTTKTLHFKLDVRETGDVTYTFGNKNGTTRSVEGKIPDWSGAWIGILTFNSEAEFSNISFTNRATEDNTNLEEITFGGNYHTNLGESASTKNGTWEVKDGGLYSNASGNGDAFLYYSETKGQNFIYSTDVTFKSTEGAASLIFRNGSNKNAENCYVVNIDAASKECKFWRWEEGFDNQLIDAKKVTAAEGNNYTLKVVAIDSWISYYVNDELVASSGDYTLQKEDKGQNTFLSDGYFGLLNWNGEMVFQNTYYSEITDKNTPLLDDIKITSSIGDVEKKTQFVPTEPITIQYVKNNAETVNVEVTKKSEDAQITIKDEAGNEYKEGKNIPVKEGKNYITITSSVKTDNEVYATLTYKVNIHRRQSDDTYYNEQYRDQYHYSVKDGWANDPNGMVYYKGKYHLFYQFYDDITWGPMHWAHATSPDMIHWTEEPIALYPDANGAMFSGCIVVDEKNTSGFFNGVEGGGLVALITADGNGQRIKLAYSTDEGTTWTKVDKIAADWTDDPLRVDAFRDPKVFRWENRWFMVVAGGPLRIYSSDNLKEWKCESAYPDLHTECPDLYPVQATDGTLKWVLSRGGRFYKVGDFKEVDGKWKFVPDAAYNISNKNEDDGVMNFGQDSYAAMTFYKQDFGTAINPNIPEIIEINWMNTWNDNYCRRVAEKTGEKFNGTFNLVLKLGLIKKGRKYVLTQTPIKEYEKLRDEAVIDVQNEEVGADNNLLENFKGDCYEIVSKFTPADSTNKVGFKLRTGNNEETLVVYDANKEELSIDRSQSGIVSISNVFKIADGQKNVRLNDDGTIDLHIYVDKASVEAFANGYTVAGANQIFPSKESLGASVFVEGAPATADITIYPMNTAWTDEDFSNITDEYPVTFDTSAVKNATVSIKKDSEAFKSGDNVSGTDKLQLTITPNSNYEFSTAPKVVADNASVSTATLKDGSYTFEIHSFKEATKITVSGEASEKESEIKEDKTDVEDNVGEASLSKTDFNDIQKDIKTDVVSALEDMTKNASTDNDKKAAQKAIKALEKNEAFLEMALTLVKKSGGITENEKINQDNQITAIKEKVQADNSGATVEVKTAITLDIELRTICKSKTNNSTIASTSVSKLTKPVTISMKLSDEIKIPKKENGVTREYYIICLHKNKDGKIEPEKIPCSYDDKTNTISFPANRFSTYVLCYVDITPKSSNSSIVLNGGTSAGSGAGAGSATATTTPVPTATTTPVPTTTASAKPGVTGGTTPTATPVPSDKPSATGTPSVTGNPVATNPPADSTATPSSEIKEGTKVTVKDSSYKVTSIGNTKTVKYIGAKKDVKKAVIPAAIEINGKKYKVTVVANNAFKGNKKLTKVTIGKNVKSIGKNAFKGCKNLKKIIVKTKKLTAKKVGSNAFKGINSNATVKVPKNKVKAYKQILKTKGAGKNIKVTK